MLCLNLCIAFEFYDEILVTIEFQHCQNCSGSNLLRNIILVGKLFSQYTAVNAVTTECLESHNKRYQSSSLTNLVTRLIRERSDQYRFKIYISKCYINPQVSAQVSELLAFS